ncbi:MAG: RNA-binding S4 domain-containing protein [Kiritimatiellales bacterium]
MNEFCITGKYIELSCRLKAAKLCNTGGEAKSAIGKGWFQSTPKQKRGCAGN